MSLFPSLGTYCIAPCKERWCEYEPKGFPHDPVLIVDSIYIYIYYFVFVFLRRRRTYCKRSLSGDSHAARKGKWAEERGIYYMGLKFKDASTNQPTRIRHAFWGIFLT